MTTKGCISGKIGTGVSMGICVCGRKQIDPVGPEGSRILIVGTSPDEDDVKRNMPFSGKRGEVLSGELARVGIPMQVPRFTYLDLHSPSDDCAGNFAGVCKEMRNRDGVLLIGAECAERFQLGRVSDLVGLCVESFYFPHSVKFVMVTTQPPTGDLIGEFRLSIEKFARKLKEVKND